MAIGENSPCFKFIRQELGTNLIGVEIGIGDGGNAEAVLNYIYPRKYYMIDPYLSYSGNPAPQHTFEALHNYARSRFSSYHNIEFIRISSFEASKILPNDLDFVYVDGAHDYDNKILDLNSWWPKIRNGGILCGDDFEIPDVTRAVKDFCNQNNIQFTLPQQEHPHPVEFIIIKREVNGTT